MVGPNWKLEDDLKTVTVTFPTNPPVALKLSVDGVDDMLRNLGEFRAVMAPEIVKSHPLGQKIAAIPDPAWASEPDAMFGQSLLHLRDPRYGWLHYLLPRSEADKLGQILQKQAGGPDPASSQGRPN